MSPELYAIIGVGIGLASLMIGLSGIFLYLNNQTNRRIEGLETRMIRLEGRFDRLEDKFDQLLESIHSLDIRVSKLEWMLDAALYGKPVGIPPESANGGPG